MGGSYLKLQVSAGDTPALDPDWFRGASTTYSLAHMTRMARDRRVGFWMSYDRESWGHQLGNFVNLRQLDIALAAHESDKSRLDQIIGCAQIWTFPHGATNALRFKRVVIVGASNSGIVDNIHRTGVVMRRSGRQRAAQQPSSATPPREPLTTRLMIWVRGAM